MIAFSTNALETHSHISAGSVPHGTSRCGSYNLPPQNFSAGLLNWVSVKIYLPFSDVYKICCTLRNYIGLIWIVLFVGLSTIYWCAKVDQSWLAEVLPRRFKNDPRPAPSPPRNHSLHSQFKNPAALQQQFIGMLPTQPTELVTLCHCDPACERLSTPSAPHHWCGSSGHPKAHLDFNSKLHGEKTCIDLVRQSIHLRLPTCSEMVGSQIITIILTGFVLQGRIGGCENAHCVVDWCQFRCSAEELQKSSSARPWHTNRWVFATVIGISKAKSNMPKKESARNNAASGVLNWTKQSSKQCLTFIGSWEAAETSSNTRLTVKRLTWHKGKQLAALKLCVVLVFAAAGKGANCLDVVLHLAGKIKPTPNLTLWRHTAGKQRLSSRCMFLTFLQQTSTKPNIAEHNSVTVFCRGSNSTICRTFDLLWSPMGFLQNSGIYPKF